MSQAHYILSKRIARGGMAEIFLGKAVGADGFSKIVVIKRILPQYATEKEFIEMFRDEANICSLLQHPNLVKVYNFEEVKGSYAIIMEFVNGCDLRTLLAACEKSQTRLPIPTAVYITAMAARGLHCAHTTVDRKSGQLMNIIHRDISPQNILLSFKGEVKVTDFGIADASNKSTETKPGVIKGKYAYMSPEQINAKKIDARTDVFALSVVLWEMLAMKRLFQGDNEVQTIKNVQTSTPRFNLQEVNPQVDDQLAEIIYRGLAKDTKRRISSAQELESRLISYIKAHFPDFRPNQLEDLLSLEMGEKKLAYQKEIKGILTNSNQQTNQVMLAKSSPSKSRATGMDTSMLKLQNQNNHVRRPKSMAPKSITPKSMAPGVRSQTSRRMTTKTVNRTQQRVNSQKKALNKILPLLVAASCILAVGLILGLGWMNESKMTIKFSTTPQRVKVNVDQTPLFSSLHTPGNTKSKDSAIFEIPVKPGERKITISRKGYFSASRKVKGKNKEIKDLGHIKLVRNTSVRFQTLSIVTRNLKDDATIVIDDYSHLIKAPSKVKDLVVEKHILTVYPEFPEKTGGFACEIETKRRLLKVIIDPKAKNICRY